MVRWASPTNRFYRRKPSDRGKCELDTIRICSRGGDTLGFFPTLLLCERPAALSNQPLPIAERQHAAWLGDVERSVILPLKWTMLVLSLLFWMWSRAWQFPSPAAFGLYIFFAGITLGEQYFFARDRITPRQVRSFVLGSFVLDAVFVSSLVVTDILDVAERQTPPVVSDFFILYILLVLRGFALFRSRFENFTAFVLVSGLFLLAASFQVSHTDLILFQPAVYRLVLIWGVMLLVQAFIGLVNVQKEEQVRAAEQMVRSASLASIGELAAGVAHEIRNPIGIIKAYADYLERAASPGDQNQEDYETIRREAERCEEIIKRMLDFSNPQVQGFTPLDIEELVRETLAFVFHEARSENIRAELVEGIAVPRINGDAVQFRQALLNILMNAREILATHLAENPGAEGNVQVAILRGSGPRPPVRIEVRDNGPGISPADAERVFEPFFTRRARGTGLGLSITRRIVEAHSGTIRIAPRPEGGTVVAIEIPIEGEEES